MDELIQHCLRELSFDGDLGCDVSRLRDFITEFYTHQASADPNGPTPHVRGQQVDDAFCAFVWAVIVQQPGVRVGTVPPEGPGSAEVYIAPQASAVRKAKARGEEGEEPAAPTPDATGLEIVDDATVRSLEDLRAQYDDRLRIAVDPETIFVALTGSHIRPSKLTPMIYSGLQLITRGREHGVSVLDIGKKSGYDQKTCFYIIKQLVELNLIVKLRQPGVSTNICVHKYFYERSPIWQQVSTEEKEAVSKEADGDSEEDDGGEETKPFVPVNFDPIDARHLSSLPVIKSRLAKLLKNCPHQMHTSNNLIVKIGFVNPTRPDRRFFRTRLKELVDEGFIERVQVAHADRRRFPNKKVLCIRLVADEGASQSQPEGMVLDDDEVQVTESESLDGATGLKMNLSIHRQIIDCLADAGTKGMTLNEISAALGDFDKRTIDLLLNRFAKEPPPSHLADLGIAQLAETHGRERRYKYYTIANYQVLVDQEQLDDAQFQQQYQSVNADAVGGFMPVDADAFYDDTAVLDAYLHKLTTSRSVKGGKTPAKKRVNPLLPDGTVKKGRPRKTVLPDGEDGVSAATPSKKGRKRKREQDDAEDADPERVEPPPKKRRGRPPKNPPAVDASQAGPSASTPSAPKKRGRPPKKKAVDANGENTQAGPSSAIPGPTPKRRGRPPKNRPAAVSPLAEAPPQAQGDEVAPSPLSALSGTTPEDAASAGPPAQVSDGLPVASALSAPGTPAGVETSRRKSTRTPKVRKRGDSLSPTRTSARRTRKLTAAAIVPTSISRGSPEVDMEVDVEPLAELDLGGDGTADETAVAETTDVQPNLPEEVTSPLPLASSQHDLPIDPILLGSEGVALISMTPEPEASSISTAQDASKKRDLPDSASTEPTSKWAKGEGSKFRTRTNLSQSRREGEILRLLANADGIMNVSCKEFFEAHAALVDTIVKEGGEASTRPGARIDKRTLEGVLRELETKGKVKLITTSVQTLTGGTRQARIAYLPDTTQDALSAFLSDLTQDLQVHQTIPFAMSIKTLETPIPYGGGRKKRPDRVSTTAAPDNVENNSGKQPEQGQGPGNGQIADITQLFDKDDGTIRDALLMDKNTAAQSYGYLVGKAARAHTLHALTAELFEQNTASSRIVSHEQRILHLSYYFTDISISRYCSLVAVVEPNDELGRLLDSPSRETPIHSLSETLIRALAPAQARSRARLISLLDFLKALDIVTPLVPSKSPTPTFSCLPNDEHPAAFDVDPNENYTPATAPLYWKFNDAAPLRLWSIGDGLPPMWKVAPLFSCEQVAAYWCDLERVSSDKDFALHVLGSAPSAPEDNMSDDVQAIYKTLRRPVSWSAVYNLSFYQAEYLRRYIDPATGNTPLEDSDETSRQAQLHRLAHIISASPDVVTRWFGKARKKHLRDLKKIKHSASKGKKTAKADDVAAEDAGVVLARRAAEAKEQRERDWVALVESVHSGELRASAAQRIHRLRMRYLSSSGKSSEKWEARIRDAIREADMVAENLLATARNPLFAQAIAATAPAHPAPASTIVTQDKDVEELITAQGPPVPKKAKTGQKTRKGKEKDTSTEVKTPRRHRFLWNRDYDELVRDGSVIIKARCRDGARLDWAAMEQLFPAVPRNSVRQRLVHLKEVPGTETYLARLEEKWYDIWVQYRGTEELPDPDPESVTNFDLITHVKFLRNHIDKNAVRVGFVEVDSSYSVDLPASLEDIAQHYDVVEKVPAAPPWDFMWSVVAEEAREKLFAHHAFTAGVGDMPPTSSTYPSDTQYVADAAVKMVLGNPNETYDMDVASELLKVVGEERVKDSTTDLLNRGVLAKVVRDPARSKPGRTLKISDSNSNSLGGPFARELLQDAVALEESIRQQQQHGSVDWQEWSLLATDGDTAFLLELASEDKVRFDVDTSHPRSMRALIDWNSKKADDDDIETAVRVRYADVVVDAPPSAQVQPGLGQSAESAMQVDGPDGPAEDPTTDPIHGVAADGGHAFCGSAYDADPELDVDGKLVDCPACLAHAARALLAQLNADERAIAEELLSALRDAGYPGLTRAQLLAKFGLDSGSGSGSGAGSAPEPAVVLAVAQRLVDAAPVPLAHWTGYAAIVLVAASNIRPWTVTVTSGRHMQGESTGDGAGDGERDELKDGDGDGAGAPDADAVTDTDTRVGTLARAGAGEEAARKALVFPRRWLDIYGRKLLDAWDAAARAVLGLVLLRPGISQAEIRWRLRAAYDRQEVCEVLQALAEDGQIAPRGADGARRPSFGGGPADAEVEKVIFWFLGDGDRRWYQV